MPDPTFSLAEAVRQITSERDHADTRYSQCVEGERDNEARYWQGREEMASAVLAILARHAAAALREPVEEREVGWMPTMLLETLEFGIYRRTGGREGLMCGVCYRFKREGHDADCWLGVRLAALRAAQEPTEGRTE